MDYLRDLSDFIDDLPDHNPFDPVVQQLPKLEWQMTALLRKLRSQIELFRTAQREYHTRSMRRVHMSAPASHNLDINWAVARQRRRGEQQDASATTAAVAATTVAKTSIIPVPPTLSHEPHDVEVSVSRNMSLRCVEIPDINAIRNDGTLYYLPRIRRFAIRIAGFILQGNIGVVYSSEPSPQKIHDCEAYPSCNMAVCRYYHNPLTCPGSTDIRNFAATSWLYRPGAHTSGTKKTRKLASRSSLDEDILTISSADLAYYNEQLMHDLLCGIIMNYFVRKDS